LATRVAFVLAGVLALALLGIYLSICNAVDAKVLPGLGLNVRVVGRIGPAFVVGVLSTLPVSLIALATDQVHPKDSPMTAVYLAALVAAVAATFLLSAKNRPTVIRSAAVSAVLVALAALSYAV
jgi:hypothetical protein